MNCKQCGEPITQTPGKRKKEFCNNTCRSNYWYGKNKKAEITSPGIFISKKKTTAPVDLVRNRVGGIQSRTIADAKKKLNQMKNTPPNAPKGKYISLEQLKAACPPNLKGIDRSIWINNERKENGL